MCSPRGNFGRTLSKTRQNSGDHTVLPKTLPRSLVMKLGGCEVVLKSKGKVVREVDTTLYEDDETIISCYVPSKPGEVSAELWLVDDPISNLMGVSVIQKFLIEYSRNLDYGPLNTELSVDVYFGGIPDFPGWIAPDPAPRAKKVTGKILGSRRGGSLHKYMFSEPELIGPSLRV